MWEELKRDRIVYSFPPAGCAPLFPKHDATAEERRIHWDFMAYLQHKTIWGLFLYSEDSWHGTVHIHNGKKKENFAVKGFQDPQLAKKDSLTRVQQMLAWRLSLRDKSLTNWRVGDQSVENHLCPYHQPP